MPTGWRSSSAASPRGASGTTTGTCPHPNVILSPSPGELPGGSTHYPVSRRRRTGGRSLSHRCKRGTESRSHHHHHDHHPFHHRPHRLTHHQLHRLAHHQFCHQQLGRVASPVRQGLRSCLLRPPSPARPLPGGSRQRAPASSPPVAFPVRPGLRSYLLRAPSRAPPLPGESRQRAPAPFPPRHRTRRTSLGKSRCGGTRIWPGSCRRSCNGRPMLGRQRKRRPAMPT